VSRDDAGRFLSEEVSEMVAACWIVGVLANAGTDGLQFTDLFKAALERDFSKSTLHRQLAAEIEAGRVRKIGHGRYAIAPTQ